jgi:predicted NUDIX family NTP pyrophosphohydrolase
VSAKRSAGILPFRRADTGVEVLLVHPGGPYWASRDEGAWSIPKGEVDDGEEPLACAMRELGEELGPECVLSDADPIALGSVRQKAGKVVEAWAAEGRFDPAGLRSGTFSLEWPPRSGERQEFPEVDRAEWFDPELARRKLNPAQADFLDRLLERLR